MKCSTLLLSSFAVLISCNKHPVPISPCPDIFNYFISQTREVFGAFSVPNDLSGDYSVRVKMSVPASAEKGIELRIVTSKVNISNGNDIEYYVIFPDNDTLPYLTEIAYNGRVLCNGRPPRGSRFNTLSNLVAVHHSKIDLNSSVYEQTSSVNISLPEKYTTNCGEPTDTTPLIVFGTPTGSGDYPWLVTLMTYNELSTQYTFRCAATLISERFVITAAHCVSDRGETTNKNLLTAVLGKHNLKSWATQSILREISSIFIHPSYKTTSDADIAILRMSKPVQYTYTIKPICLWSGNDDLKNLVGTEGVVTGWGRDETGNDFIEEARQLTMPVVSNERCLDQDSMFSKLISSKTFCAGRADGSGPCTGDSGGGFYVKRDQKWVLRGIVSAGLLDVTKKTCDTRRYTVFADVPKYTDWILSVIN